MSRPRRYRPRRLVFFRSFLTRPGQIGAVLPSGPELARRIARPIDLQDARCIVELGPGTGAFTEALLAGMSPRARLIAIEANPQMGAIVASTFPEVELVHDDAGRIRELLQERGVEEVDAVVSGLPFTTFPPRLQTRVVEGAHAVLKPGGLFLSFTYYYSRLLPACHRFEALLRRTFGEVDRLPVLRNLPPAFVFRCRKEGPAAGAGERNEELRHAV